MMNEYLTEIAMEANAQIGNEFDLNFKKLDALLCKFAELLVQDCLGVCEDNHNDSGDEWDCAVRSVMEGIKTKYGVNNGT